MNREIARIIDANLNRAREALRVMEEYARFVLDDPAGCEVVKRLRHDLAACAQQLPARALLAARDTPGDVGTAISTPSEAQRADAASVFTAAAKRLPEALRAIEEYAKVVAPAVSAGVEALRYRAYDVEQRLALRGELSGRFARTRLYVLITASLCRGDWLQVAAAAIDGGADCLQLREKGLEDLDLLERARRLAALCRERGVLFIVNDRPDLAVLSGADGVHLGQTDLPPADARRMVGPERLIGLSTHTPDQLRAAIAAGPDYIAVGPMFDSSTKPQAHIAGRELLSLAEDESTVPVVPIGGITLGNAGILAHAGARRLCVCSAVIAADDPLVAARALREKVASTHIRADRF